MNDISSSPLSCQERLSTRLLTRAGARWLWIAGLLLQVIANLPAQTTDVPEKERELGLTPSALGGNKLWMDSITIASLSFFEKGQEFLPADQRQYQTEFDQSKTRYVAWDLQLQYPAVAQSQDWVLEAVFFGPQGDEIGRIEHQMHCEAGETTSSHSRGWGWPEPGFWAEGVYRVAFYTGERSLGEKSFSIVRSSVEITHEEWLRSIGFDYLRFYEKGRETIPYDQRVYRSWFPQASTRYIAWELHLKHPVVPKAAYLSLQAIYYFPDGRVFGRDEIKTWVDPGWSSSWHTSGWGWAEAGYWQTGLYRVEFYVEGQRLTTGYFEIK